MNPQPLPSEASSLGAETGITKPAVAKRLSGRVDGFFDSTKEGVWLRAREYFLEEVVAI